MPGDDEIPIPRLDRQLLVRCERTIQQQDRSAVAFTSACAIDHRHLRLPKYGGVEKAEKVPALYPTVAPGLIGVVEREPGERRHVEGGRVVACLTVDPKLGTGHLRQMVVH